MAERTSVIAITIAVISLVVAGASFASTTAIPSDIASLRKSVEQSSSKLSSLEGRVQQVGGDLDLLAKATGVPLGKAEDIQKLIAEKELIAAAQKEGVVRMLGSKDPAGVAPWAEAFRNKYGIRLEHQEFQPDDITPKLLAEYGAGRHDWDIVEGNAEVIFVPLKQQGLLVEIKDPILQANLGAFPPKLVDSHYLNFILSPNGIVYNKKAVANELDKVTYEDLATNPIWKGRIGLRDAIASGSAARNLGGIYLMFGEDRQKTVNWLKDVLKQDPIINPDDGFLEVALESEQVDVVITGISLNVIARNIINKGDVYPLDWARNQAIFVSGEAIGILRDSPHPNAAKLFFQWISSKEGMEVVGTGNTVSRPDVSSRQTSMVMAQPDLVIPLPPERLNELRNLAQQIWREAVG